MQKFDERDFFLISSSRPGSVKDINFGTQLLCQRASTRSCTAPHQLEQSKAETMEFSEPPVATWAPFATCVKRAKMNGIFFFFSNFSMNRPVQENNRPFNRLLDPLIRLIKNRMSRSRPRHFLESIQISWQ